MLTISTFFRSNELKGSLSKYAIVAGGFTPAQSIHSFSQKDATDGSYLSGAPIWRFPFLIVHGLYTFPSVSKVQFDTWLVTKPVIKIGRCGDTVRSTKSETLSDFGHTASMQGNIQKKPKL